MCPAPRSTGSAQARQLSQPAIRSFAVVAAGACRSRNGNKSGKHFTANVSWTSHRIKFTPLCWTTVSTSAAFARCTEFLGKTNASKERRNQLRRPNYKKPELLATGPNQVWSWDITKLKGPEKWTYYYLYVILDIYSRYVVGWMLAHREQAELATKLIRETVAKQNVHEDELIIHSDRGPSMTSHSVTQLLISLGVTKSHSRPHVSNDNPFSESHFKTMKYRPEFPDRFGCHEDGLSFCRHFFDWYNDEHYHSGIGLVTPASLHYGQASKVVASRQQVLAVGVHRSPGTIRSRDPNATAIAIGRVDQSTFEHKSQTKRKGFRKSTVPRSHETRL